MRGRQSGGRVKDESLKEELLEQRGLGTSAEEEPNVRNMGPRLIRKESSVMVLVPTIESIFRWSGEGETLEGLDESNIGLLDEHKLSIQELGLRYSTSLDPDMPENSQGMDPDRATQVLSMVGPNELSPPPSVPAWKLFLRQLMDPLNLMLICAAALCILIYILSISSDTDTEELQLGLVLLIVILVNTMIDFTQKQNAKRVLNSFATLVSPQTLVIRRGEILEIDLTEIIMGDIVKLTAGDQIPADIRFIWVNSASVDNSSLTGESAPLNRKVEASTDDAKEAENMGFFGTTLRSGSGIGVVIRTGDRTLMGQMAKGAKQSPPSPLTIEMERFVIVTAVIASITAIAFLIVGLCISSADFKTLFILIIGIFVAFVPQGLPATVTMLLTFAAVRLKEVNVLVKDLNAVDTLGTITLLASDKTGTLTVSRMTVVNMWMNGRLLSTETGDFDLKAVANAETMLQCFLLNTTAQFTGVVEAGYGGATKIIGDATESGMLRFATPLLLNNERELDSYRLRHHKVFSIPFDSSRKWALTIHKLAHERGSLTLFMKGAPERVIARCSYTMAGAGGGPSGASSSLPIDSSFHESFGRVYEDLASRGERVLACAILHLDGNSYPEDYVFDEDNYPTTGYSFIGLVGLRDPPKPGVREAIDECKIAGVQVVMVTGDHPLTAEAIGRQVGILHGESKAAAAKRLGVPVSQVHPEEYDCAIIHGNEIDDLDNDQWDEILSKKEIVFARVVAEQKLEIVVRCQSMGHVVGVTGDGVNDALALQRADMGISMGLTGSDVSKGVASIVLLDDHFASVVRGIREGRLIFTNLKKSIMYTLCHITPEVVPFLLYIIVSIPVPINSFLILCLDLGTEIGPALSFAWEAPEENIMSVEPRRYVKPKAPPVVARRDEVEALSQIRNVEVREVDILQPDHQVVAHRLGYYWFRINQWKLLGSNEEDERLVDGFVYAWSYAQAGVIITIAALAAYFWEMRSNGICIQDLLYAAEDYFTSDADSFVTCKGVVLDANQQLLALYRAQSAYFASIVVCQFFDAHVCKVRRGVPWGPQFCRNKRTYYAYAVSFCLTVFIIVTPEVRDVLYARPFHMNVMVAPLLGGFFILFYETVRRSLFPEMGLVNHQRVRAERARLQSLDSDSDPGERLMGQPKSRGGPSVVTGVGGKMEASV